MSCGGRWKEVVVPVVERPQGGEMKVGSFLELSRSGCTGGMPGGRWNWSSACSSACRCLVDRRVPFLGIGFAELGIWPGTLNSGTGLAIAVLVRPSFTCSCENRYL